MNFSKFFLDIFFPKFCLFCKREGFFLCPDCKSTLPLYLSHIEKRQGFLKDLYFALPYKDPRVNFLIKKMKYPPFLKELSQELSLLLIEHFQLIDPPPSFSNFIVVPVPLSKKREKWRGFNQAEEISKEIARFFNLKLEKNLLIRKKETQPQVDLTKEKRKENLKNAFKTTRKIEKEKILLVDDVYTSGATLQEAAKTLKEKGAQTIIGVVLAKEF